MLRKLITILTFVITLTATAQDTQPEEVPTRLRRLFFDSHPDSLAAYFELCDELKQNYLDRGEFSDYYQIIINEVYCEIQHRRFFEAITRANNLREDLKNNGHDKDGSYIDYFYAIQGVIYYSLGRYEQADQYYKQAIFALIPTGRNTMTGDDYLRLGAAHLNRIEVDIMLGVDQLWQINEQMYSIFHDEALYDRIYHCFKAQAHFLRDEHDDFLAEKKIYDDFPAFPEAVHAEQWHPRLNIMENIVRGNTSEALLQIDSLSKTDIFDLDIAALLHEKMGRSDLALADIRRRQHLQDSLTNVIETKNFEQLNITMGMSQLKEQAARQRERAMTVILFLFAAAIALLAWRYVTRRRLQRQIIDKNQQLEIALDEAQESDRMKTAFIQHVSHEMRTPLNIITGNVQLIANPDFDIDPDDRRQLLAAIDENTHNITTIINDLLEMSLQGSKQHYRLDDDVDINQFCRQALDQATQKNNGRLQFDFNTTIADGYTLHTSRQALERILRQLLSNALKFTPDGGTIRLTAQLTADGHTIELAVADTGIGIAPEYHEKVFEEFFKVDSFRQGMGVGLTVARKTATALGGALAIDSAYTDGARFVLLVPVGK